MQHEVDSSAASPPVFPRRRFQYSLSTLMLVTTIVALLAALLVTYRQREEARAEVKKFRGEMGYLDVADARKIYARSFRAPGDNRWAWRVYLPEKRKYRLYMSQTGIPQEGFPYHQCNTPIASGELLIDAAAQEGRNGKWRLCVHVRGHEDEGGFSTEMAPIPGNGWGSESVSSREQKTLAPDKPLVLLRGRKMKDVGTVPGRDFQTDPGPTEGIMVWIEEERPSTAGPPVSPTITPGPPAAAGGK